MCDWMELKNSVYINCMSGDTIDFFSWQTNIIDIRDDLRALFEPSTCSYQSNIGVQTVASTIRHLEKSGMYTSNNTEVGIEINTIQ